MAKLCGMLAYWSGCLSVVVLMVAFLSVPRSFAGSTSGQCSQYTEAPFGCVSPGLECTSNGKKGLCGPPIPNSPLCNCNQVGS
jgi:hypothetical protein